MESSYLFKVYYGKELVCTMVARTKWEAVDRAYYKYLYLHPNIERSLFRAKK
jgi:hypothetical protein